MSYTQFLDRKSHIGNDGGFDPDYMPDFLFDFQRALVEWSCRKGRSAILADCGLGKTAMQLVWANNVVRKTNRPLLMFRRRGENPVPVTHETGLLSYAGERQPPDALLHYRGMKGDQKKNVYSQYIWRQYASSVWDDIRIDRVLPHRKAKDDEDEKHVHPLQLDVIERAVVMWSNPGEKVLTPFMGVGSEVVGAMMHGRKAIGAELKPSYYRQAVLNIDHMKDVDASTATDPALFATEEAA